MKEEVAKRSKMEGFARSRLPAFTPEEVAYIRGTYDYFALNHYTTEYVEDAGVAMTGKPSVEKDARIMRWANSSWSNSASTWLHVRS